MKLLQLCQEVYRSSRGSSGALSRKPADRPARAPHINLGRDDRLRITVVTPIFPTSAEPYRGWPIFKTVSELQDLAAISVVCPICTFPRWRWFQPRSLRYNEIDTRYRPGEFDFRYLQYRSFPILGRPFNGLNSATRILPVIRAGHPDVILAFWIYPEGFASYLVGRTRNIPVVLGSRGSDLRPKDPLSRLLTRQALRNANAVLTVSEELRQRAIENGVMPERAHTIINGIDSSVMFPQDQEAIRQKLGLPLQGKRILFIGWLNATKGLKELLKAFTALLVSHPSVELTVIGEGPMEKELLQANESGPLKDRVRVVGPCERDGIANWLAASDLLCLPSWAEGCPNVVLEALACGRPVVASTVGGIPDLVKPDNGILVPPHTVEPLTDALRSALFDQLWDYQAISAGWTRSWTTVAEETYEICRSVVAETQRSRRQ